MNLSINNKKKSFLLQNESYFFKNIFPNKSLRIYFLFSLISLTLILGFKTKKLIEFDEILEMKVWLIIVARKARAAFSFLCSCLLR